MTAIFEDQDMQERISKTQPGQVTWVDLASKAKCSACAHYQPNVIAKGKRGGFGRCGLVKAFTKKDGRPFDGVRALTCGQFKAAQ